MSVNSSSADLFLNPSNVGDAAEPSFIGRSASLECGATIRISLQVDEEQRISDVKFRAAGCSSLVAAASLLTTLVKDRTTADAALLAQNGDRAIAIQDQAAREKEYCAALASEALISAISAYSDSMRVGWEGDEALICTCFGVSERVIADAIKTRMLVSIEDVTLACNAGGGCRSCYPLIQEILDAS